MATKAEREAKKAARRARLLRSNPWLQRPRRERLGFAAAGFCLFSIIGVLNTWFNLPAIILITSTCRIIGLACWWPTPPATAFPLDL